MADHRVSDHTSARYIVIATLAKFRVALGFVFGVLVLILAQPTAGSLTIGMSVAAVGEAGVGKSRLLYEFVHWRDCVGAGRSPFPATASAEGAQFNVPPSLSRTQPPCTWANVSYHNFAHAHRLRRSLDQVEMGGPASPLTGPGPSRNDLGIDGHLMKHGEQGDGGEFVEQVIG